MLSVAIIFLCRPQIFKFQFFNSKIDKALACSNIFLARIQRSRNQIGVALPIVFFLDNFRICMHVILTNLSLSLQKIIKVKSHGGFIFMKGQLKELTDLVKSQKDISAVFVNVDILKINQVAMLQGAWQLPVFDRYCTCLLYLQLNFYRT